ncbi:MAG: hypothetical protein IKV52_00850 [Oscillospiraceae bacterium]|nr:hypothetical protein [Oscillospiraceae bacterium]
MKQSVINKLLVAGTVIPIVMLFWPFAQYGTVAGIMLRFVAAFCLQAFFCRIKVHRIVAAIPMTVALVIALWGGYLLLTSESWINATLGGYIADYVTMLFGCVAAVAVEKRI